MIGRHFPSKLGYKREERQRTKLVTGSSQNLFSILQDPGDHDRSLGKLPSATVMNNIKYYSK